MSATSRPTPSSQEIANVYEVIERHKEEIRPRGMTADREVLYQPIPFPEFSHLACERDSSPDRLEMLRAHLPDLQGKRILDLGCANGFFLLSMAQLEDAPAAGMGVDYFTGNVALANQLAKTYGVDDRFRFTRGAINLESIEGWLEEEWDVCLLLSVHHHLNRTLGIEETKAIIARLSASIPTLIMEQGSLTQEEYEEWTGRDEPFTTRGFSRMVSMYEACGIPAQRCFALGMGEYRSGLRPDTGGAGRVLVGTSHATPTTGRVGAIQRKAHKNGVYMELVEVGEEEFWKNVVAGDSLAPREYEALSRLQGTGHAPELVDPERAFHEAEGGWLRLRRRDLVELDTMDTRPLTLRTALVEGLMVLARAGVMHHELCPEHVLWDRVREHVCFVDFETSWFRGESRTMWRREVMEANPALGLGYYPRQLLDIEPHRADVVAMSRLLERWELEPFTRGELEAYSVALLGERANVGAKRREVLTVLIPCYNEEHNVARAVQEVLDTRDELDLEVRIEMIDDGSTDGTREVMEALCARHVGVCTIHVNAKNKGVGRSVLDAYERLPADHWVTVFPGDAELVFASIKNHIAVRHEYDLVLGYLQNKIIRPFKRRLASDAFRYATDCVYGYKFQYLNGMKLYRAGLFKGLDVDSNGHAFNAELLAKATLRKSDLRVGEVPFRTRGRAYGNSKAFRPSSVAEAVSDLLRGYQSVSRYRDEIIKDTPE